MLSSGMVGIPDKDRRENSVNDNNKIIVMLTINKLIIGGAEQQFLELVKGLDQAHFKPIVVTLNPGGDLEPEVKNIPGVEYICLNRKGKFNFFTLFTMLRLLRKKHVDVIQPFLTPATFFTLVPAVINRTPARIITERGNKRSKPGLGYTIYLRTEDFFTRFADYVIPNSESGKSYLIKRGINPKRIRVIYNGINVQRLAPDPEKVARIRANMGVPAEGKIVGISASLTANKDHVTFLRAAKLVAKTNPQVKFAILGDGMLRPMLENLTKELGIESNVSFLGNQTEVGSYVSAFDIVCLCSAEPEGCSNSILEAMALGKPVIATNAGGNNELVTDGENGLVIPVQNPERLAEAILTYLRQPERARELGEHGRAMIASRFSLKRMVEDYEALFKEILQKNKTRSAAGKTKG
jgi:glycosyltransferase involved in cell wall biosynthesis